MQRPLRCQTKMVIHVVLVKFLLLSRKKECLMQSKIPPPKKQTWPRCWPVEGCVHQKRESFWCSHVPSLTFYLPRDDFFFKFGSVLGKLRRKVVCYTSDHLYIRKNALWKSKGGAVWRQSEFLLEYSKAVWKPETALWSGCPQGLRFVVDEGYQELFWK